MKTYRLVLIIATITITISSFAQSAFEDANKLNQFSSRLISGRVQFTFKDTVEVSKILSSYSNSKTYKELQEEINNSNNPFIRLPQSQSQSFAESMEISSTGKSLIPNFGALNVTNIADGLAQFLVERTKQELSIAFFEKFYETLDQQAQLRILFPASYKTLSIIGNEIYMFSGYIEMLRQAFQKDLATLLPNLKILVNDKSMNEVFAKHPELRIILSDGIYLALQLKDGNHIGDALNNYVISEADSGKLSMINANLYPSLVLLSIFSQSLRSTTDQKYWITSDQLKKLHDEKVLRLYLGLVYQQIYLFEKEHNKISLGGKNVLEVIRNTASDVEALKKQTLSIAQPIVEKGKLIDQKFSQIKRLQSQPDAEPGYQEFYELLDASLNFIQVVKETYVSFSGTPTTDKFDTYLTATRSLGNIYVNINEKQYVSAIAELAYLYEDLIVKQLKGDSVSQQVTDKRKAFLEALDKLLKDENDINLVTKIKKLITDNKEVIPPSNIIVALVDEGKGKKEIKALLEQLNVLEYEKALAEKYEKLIDQLIKYGNFAAVVAKAENSAQVKEAIESIALPVGSSRIKRESAFNISLNAYMGLYAGYENIKINDKENYQFATGLSAPVGLAMSWGFGGKEKGKGGKSFSLLLPLIDVGAIASFRFNDSDTEAVPEIQLKDIISPGAFAIIGFGKIPLSLGAGYQIGPRLHEVTAQNNTVADTYGRASLFIAVDIPIINFHTTPK